MKTSKLLLPFLLFVLLLSACSPAPAAPANTQPAPTQPAPTQEPQNLPQTGIQGATQTVIEMLAAQLGVDPADIQVVEASPVEWADSCLGVHLKDVMCAMVVTPGYKIVLQNQGKTYEFHTNVDASSVQVASAPDVQSADASIIWQEQDQGCSTAEISPNGVAFGSCGEDLAAGILSSQDRLDEFKHFVATYQSFDADTPDGHVILQGQGDQAATPAEQRAVAEWARLVYQELDGRSSAAAGLAFAWHREGGIAGFCDDLSVYVTGAAYASSCKGQSANNLGKVYLSPEQLQQVFDWVDSYKNFELNQSDDAKADGMTIRLVFSGSGDATISEQARLAMLDLAPQIYNQAAQGQ